VGITFNLKNERLRRDGTGVPEDTDEEYDHPGTVEAIREVLVQEGHQVFPLGGDLSVREKIGSLGIDFVFNIAEGLDGRNRESHIPALLEMMRIPYSGSDPLGLGLTLDKSLAKRIARSLDIETPEFWVVDGPRDLDVVPSRFPLFVKPLWEGSSKGIRRSSRVENRADLEREVNRIWQDYKRNPILVETYIPGRDVTVGVVGNDPLEIIGSMEIVFRDRSQEDFCYSLEVKRRWKELVEYRVPARLGPSLERAMGEAARLLFKTARLRDVARFDFRVTPEGKFYFLEINPLPGLSPESGDLVILAQKRGWRYNELVLKITRSALSRYPELRPVPSGKREERD
jgi:D-alanine-D-alanine ligase